MSSAIKFTFKSLTDAGHQAMAMDGHYNNGILALGEYLKPHGGLLKPTGEAETALRDGALLYWSELNAARATLPTFGPGPEFTPITLKPKQRIPAGALQITATYAWDATKEAVAAFPPHVVGAIKEVKKTSSSYYSQRIGRIRARFSLLTHAAPVQQDAGSGIIVTEPSEAKPEAGTRKGPTMWREFAEREFAEMAKRAVNSRTKRHDASAPTPSDFKIAEAAFWKVLTK